MAKRPVVSTINSVHDIVDTSNENFNNIKEQFDNTLSRDGSTPNNMEADLDLNSNDLLNVKDLSMTGELTVDGVDFNDKVAQAAQSAVNSEASAVRSEEAAEVAVAATIGGVDKSYQTIAEMTAETEFFNGQTVRVLDGFNNEVEYFEYVSGGSLTADGALVVDGVDGQWVSKRTVYEDWAELDADVRDLPVGTYLAVDGLIGGYTVVSSGEVLETSAGLKLVLATFGPVTPYHFGAVGDGTTDDTAPLNAFFASVSGTRENSTFDFSGLWGVTDEILIDISDGLPRNLIAGKILYIGDDDLDVLVYMKELRNSVVSGQFTVFGEVSGTAYSGRKVTDLIVANEVGNTTFDSIFGRYSKRHGINTRGKSGDSPSHIGTDFGRCYFSNCGSASNGDNVGNVRLKEYDFTDLVRSGSGTSSSQFVTVTITGGTDVLYEGAVVKYGEHFHFVRGVDEGAGTVQLFPWLRTSDTSGTLQSCHGAAFHNVGGNTASMRIGGLKVLGCGVGLSNQGLYGPVVDNFETQVCGVSYMQKGLNYGTVINGFHPETSDSDVDILKCDEFETSTVFNGHSVYRGSDVINLLPVDASGNEDQSLMTGMLLTPDGVPAFAGQKSVAAKRRTSATLRNSSDTDTVAIINRSTTTVSLERDLDLMRLFGYTSVKILRVGDSGNDAGGTTIQPTSAETTAGVTVMGGASYAVPELPDGTTILCDYDGFDEDWKVYVSVPAQFSAAIADSVGGDEQGKINDILAVLRVHGLVAT